MRISDWSSDVCSSDLRADGGLPAHPVAAERRQIFTGRPPLRHLLWSGRRVLMRTSFVTLRRTTALAALLLAGTATVAHAQRSGDAGPGSDAPCAAAAAAQAGPRDGSRRSERSAEQTSEPQSLMRTPYAVS